MALHIRSDHVDMLARKVAEKTGETITDAIGNALAERLARLEDGSKKDKETMVADLLAISERSAAAFRAAGITKTSRELIEELYDDDGLPV